MSNKKSSPSQWMAAQVERERRLNEFEQAWQKGQTPAINDFLSDDGERAELLRDLIRVELEYRIKSDEPVRVETYLQTYPELAGDAATAGADSFGSVGLASGSL